MSGVGTATFLKCLGLVPTDKEPALYPAIENVFFESTKHRDVKYLMTVLQ